MKQETVGEILQKRGVTRTIREELRRCSAIELEIGSRLLQIDVLLVAAGYNRRKILASLRGLFAWLLQTVQLAQFPPPRFLRCENNPAL